MTAAPINARDVLIRDATADDAAFICEKLAATFTNATVEERRVHFAPPWAAPAGGRDYGSVAQLGERIVGFGGFFASERIINAARVRVLNYSSWWIDPEFRGAGIGRKLIEGIFRPREAAVITLLTLPETMRDFWRLQPVSPFEQSRRVYPFPMLRPAAWLSSLRVLPAGEFPAALGEEAQRILRDHHGLRCQVLVIEDKGEYCGVITRRRTVRVPPEQWPSGMVSSKMPIASAETDTRFGLLRSRIVDLLDGELPCAEVFFVSNPGLFRRKFSAVAALLARRQRAVAIVGDSTRLGLPPEWGRPVDSDYCVWRPCPVADHQVDALYSEYFVLPIGQDSR